MRRLLAVSITIFVIAVGFFVASEIRNRQKMNKIPDPIAYAGKTVSTKPVLQSEDITAQDVADTVVEDLGAADKILDINPAEYLDAYETLQNDEEAECCPEEELLDSEEPKKTRLQIYLDRYLPKGFSRSDIERYVELIDRQDMMLDNIEPPGYGIDEHVEYWKLKCKFNPTEGHLKALESFRHQKEMIDKYGGEFKFVSGTRAR